MKQATTFEELITRNTTGIIGTPQEDIRKGVFIAVRDCNKGQIDWPYIATLKKGKSSTDNTKAIIRYGCTINVPQERGAVPILNKASAIHHAYDKKRARQTLHEGGVRVPQNNGTFPAVIRPKHHSKGKGFAIANDVDELQEIIKRKVYQNGWYASEYIDKDREIRIHASKYGWLIVGQEKKYGKEDAKKDLNPGIWNHRNGYAYYALSFAELEKWGQVAVDACRLLDLDFGAVDIMIKGDEAYVVEVNTAPAGYKLVKAMYRMFFTEWVKQDFEFEYVPTQVFKKKERLEATRNNGGCLYAANK